MKNFNISRKWFGPIFWFLFFASLWEILLRAENPSLMNDDSGETVTSAWILGIPHPPGYPLYNLLGRLSLLIPLGSIAFRLNLLSALFTWLALIFVWETCRTFYQEKSKENLINIVAPYYLVELFLAFILVSLFFCQTVFAQSLTAKGGVYTFTLCLFSLIMFVSLKPASILKKLFLVFYLFSVGLTNHWETVILWVPFLVLWLINNGFRWNLKNGLFLITLFLIGVSTYLYLPIRAQLNPVLNFQNPVNLTSFWELVSRKHYSGVSAQIPMIKTLENSLSGYWNVLFLNWWPGFILIVILGLRVLFKGPRKIFWPLALTYILIVLMTVIYPRYDENDKFFIGIYLVSVEGLLAFWAFGSLFLLSSVKNKWLAPGIISVLLIISLSWGYFVFARQDKSWFVLQSDYGLNLLKELPKNAMVLADSDEDIFSLYYLKYVQNLRPDVLEVPVPHLTNRWGFQQVIENEAKTLNLTPSNVKSFKDAMSEIIQAGEANQVPIYFSHYKKTLNDNHMVDVDQRLFPLGLTYKLENSVPDKKTLSNRVFQISSMERLRNLDKVKDLSTENTSLFFTRSYARSDLLVGDYFIKENDIDDAFLHFQHALEVNPKMEGVYLEVGKYFYNAGDLELARLLFLKEVENDSESAEGYFFLGNTCVKMNQFEQAIAAYDQSLRINPNSENARIDKATAIDSQSLGRNSDWQPKPAIYYQKMADDFEAKGIRFLSDAAHEAEKN